jgi:Zn-dependent peptidase ImmA (M78 family)
MKPVLRPGMLKECETIALEARAEVGLGAEDRLDPELLAEHLAIELRPLAAYRAVLPDAVEHLTEKAPSVFSAVTVYRDSKRRIIYNPVHSPRRHVNTIAHELAHGLLEHKPTELFDEHGNRIWIPDDEAEADYLAGALLVPLGAVEPVMVRLEGDLVDAAEHFGVSENLMQYRIEIAVDPAQVEMAEPAPILGGEAESSTELEAKALGRLKRVDDDGETVVSPEAA